jgi:oxaloacetate decarboxylase gamma subunit
MMTDQLAQAAVLFAVGMSVVFAFLTLLIGGIHSIAWFARVFPEPEAVSHHKKPKYTQQNKNNTTETTVDPSIVTAITAAVNAHRRKG